MLRILYPHFFILYFEFSIQQNQVVSVKTAGYLKYYLYQNQMAFLSLKRAHLGGGGIKMQIFSSFFPRIDMDFFNVCIVTVLCVYVTGSGLEVTMLPEKKMATYIYVYIYTHRENT